jgi:hypothetical protein
MSKAIVGAAELAGAAVLMFVPGLNVLNTPWLMSMMFSLAASGVSMEAGAIASALTSNRGMNITTRQVAALRQIIYGQQRVGGNMVYRSTTGVNNSGGNYVLNYIIPFATHSCDAYVNLYLDGRQVFWKQTPAPNGIHANVGCGTVATPPTANVTISSGIITAITATGGSGFANVKPVDGYRVKITDTGGGSGAVAWAHNSGTILAPVWSVTISKGGTKYTSATHADIQGAYTFGGTAAADQQDPTQPGYGFGYGVAPGGPKYNFSGKVYCEPRFGDQVAGDSMTSLTANDPLWSTSGQTQSNQATATATINSSTRQVMSIAMAIKGQGYTTAPTVTISGGGGGGASAHALISNGEVYQIVVDNGGGGYATAPFVTLSAPSTTVAMGPGVLGCAYLYVNIGYDATQFAGEPEIRVTMNGKDDIYDPRSGITGYSTNWALQVANVITDPIWGLGDNTVNQAQLIAAANQCDAVIATSQGNTPTYQQHIHYDTSTAPGDALSMMMETAGGKLSRIGGEWYIWPAIWKAPTLTFDSSCLVGDVQWEPKRSTRDLVNRVNGTYTAPNYPYGCVGNLYDKNGWYYGTTNNLWNYAWQPTNFPQYACDTLHGYGSDVYLTEDKGIVLPKEIELRGVIDVVQAQRLAKIELLRNRFQGTAVFHMSLAAWQLQPMDTFYFNFAQMGWANKYFEVDKIQLICQASKGESEDGGYSLSVDVTVHETDPSIYEWSINEELSPYDVQSCPDATGTPAPPTNVTLENDATTAVMHSDGTTMSRLLVTWTPPDDVYINEGGTIQIQYAGLTQAGSSTSVPVNGITPILQNGVTLVAQSSWIDAGSLNGSANYFYIDNISQFAAVTVQLRGVRSSGASSVWVQDTLGAANTPVIVNTPQSLLSIIAGVNVLTPADKVSVIADINSINVAYSNNCTLAGTASVSTTAYTSAYNTLTAYLATLTSPVAWNNTTNYTTINSTTFTSNLQALYTAQASLLASIASTTNTTANNLVSGTTPAGNTTKVGGVASTTVVLATTGQQRNLVPDSDFKFGTTYWANQGNTAVLTLGAGPSGGNAFITTGASGWGYMNSATITVVPGTVYTLSGWINASNCTAGNTPSWGIYNTALSTCYASANAVAGSVGVVSVSWTCPAGVTQVYVIWDTNNATTTSPYTMKFANPQLEVGPVATAYKSNLIDDITGSIAHGAMSTQVRNTIGSSTSLLGLDNIQDGVSRFGAAQAGADKTNAHILTAGSTPTNGAGISGSSYMSMTPFGFTLTASGPSDVYNISASIGVYGGTASNYVNIELVVDGVTASPYGVRQVTLMVTTATNTFPYFASITGLSAGTHTIVFYMEGSAASMYLSSAATYAICQRIY